jgi:hypothetical protein
MTEEQAERMIALLNQIAADIREIKQTKAVFEIRGSGSAGHAGGAGVAGDAVGTSSKLVSAKYR